MSINAFISNGTCYIAANDPAASQFFPCGNDALGHKTCCEAGDMCLSNNACYDGEYGVTYLAGCSDPDYQDSVCPDKGAFADDPWTGLVYCNGTSDEWVACPQAAQEPTLTSADFCFCPETSVTVAFTAPSVLDNVVQLPTASGGSVIWQPGYVPMPTAITVTPTPTTSTPTTGNGQATSPTETGSSSSDNGASSSVISTGAKAGIGVGVSIACAAILAALALLFLRRRRRYLDEKNGAGVEAPGTMGTPITPATPAVSELDSRAARPWSLRSELDGSDRPVSLAGEMMAETPAAAAAAAAASDKRASQYRISAGATPRIGQNASGRNSPLSPLAELPG